MIWHYIFYICTGQNVWLWILSFFSRLITIISMAYLICAKCICSIAVIASTKSSSSFDKHCALSMLLRWHSFHYQLIINIFKELQRKTVTTHLDIICRFVFFFSIIFIHQRKMMEKKNENWLTRLHVFWLNVRKHVLTCEFVLHKLFRISSIWMIFRKKQHETTTTITKSLEKKLQRLSRFYQTAVEWTMKIKKTTFHLWPSFTITVSLLVY